MSDTKNEPDSIMSKVQLPESLDSKLDLKTEPYNYYVFAQQWPSSLCKSINSTHHGTCAKVPKEVNTWAVHGLWPSVAHTKHYGPFNCNNSWPYDHDQLKTLMPRLQKFWPNLMQNKEDDSFWKHEWEKHGTCACQKYDTSSRKYFSCQKEIDYFIKAMDLGRKIDFDQAMQKGGLLPSLEIHYEFEKVYKILGDGRYQCYKGKDLDSEDSDKTMKPQQKHQVLAQIMICLNKKFERIECKQQELKDALKHVSQMGDFDTGPYSPEPCKADVPVRIYPIHMEMGN